MEDRAGDDIMASMSWLLCEIPIKVSTHRSSGIDVLFVGRERACCHDAAAWALLRPCHSESYGHIQDFVATRCIFAFSEQPSETARFLCMSRKTTVEMHFIEGEKSQGNGRWVRTIICGYVRMTIVDSE